MKAGDFVVSVYRDISCTGRVIRLSKQHKWVDVRWRGFITDGKWDEWSKRMPLDSVVLLMSKEDIGGFCECGR